jgi:hypothetical protein
VRTIHASRSRGHWFALLGLLTTLASGGGPTAAPVDGSNEWPTGTDVAPQANRPVHPDFGDRNGIIGAYGRLPLSFETNRGQTDPRVDFLARGQGYTIFLTPREAVLTLRPGGRSPESPLPAAVLRLQLLDANLQPQAIGQKRLPGTVSYFIGSDPAKWRRDVPAYAEVTYREIYPGIDLLYYGNQGQLEYDFVVHPGNDSASITTRFDGAEQLRVTEQGDLIVEIAGRTLRQPKPHLYQEVNGTRKAITGGYTLKAGLGVGFWVSSYDRSRPLVIDPTLVYSTYLGGSSLDTVDHSGVIAVDNTGNAYVTGLTFSPNFPTTAGSYDPTPNAGGQDAFVTKLDATGSMLVYSTYLGGSDFDQGSGIALDSATNAYVTGRTHSIDFPTTAGGFDRSFNGGGDAFVTKLDPSGSMLVYSTYIGGSDFDHGFGIGVDAADNASVTGQTLSLNFPTTPGSFDTSANGGGDAFVTKLDAAGAMLAYSTYLGGGSTDFGFAIAVDASGHAHITGRTESIDFPTTPASFDTTANGSADGFVTKVNPVGSAPLLYSTYLGGSGFDQGFGLAIDTSGNAVVTGFTQSVNFPTTAGSFDTTFNGSSDAFVTKVDPIGSAPLLYSTYLGGSDGDFGLDVTVDAMGNAHVTGQTSSVDFPTTADAVDTMLNGPTDAFVTKVNSAGSAPLVSSTYLGGTAFDRGSGIAVDPSGNTYIAGLTSSADFPVTAGAYDTTYNGNSDVFVTKIGFVGAPATVTVTPPAATNPVDTQHCVTATVRDAFGNPVPGVTVRFTVTGAVMTSGSATTDANGQAIFCYQGPALPGADTITAFADTDGDGTQDPGEPAGAAAKVWTLPVTTPLCEIRITNGGWIIAANGDRASFGGNAKADAAGNTQGQEQYQDHGPVQPLNMHSINVLAIVCEGTTEASIFGQATIDGLGPFHYRIRVQDIGEPGPGQDTYGLLLQTGYSSGEQVLQGGNVQIRRQ